MKKFIYILLVISIPAVMTGCGNPSPTSSGYTPMMINKYFVHGAAPNATIIPSPNNPFRNPLDTLSSDVSVVGFGAASSTTLITLVKTTAPTTSIPFQESITLSTTATFAAYQTITNITGRNGVSGFAQAVSALNGPFVGEEMLRKSEAQLLKQGGSFTKPVATAGMNALGNLTPDASGTVNTFWVAVSGNPANDASISATCAYVGPNVYIYVDNATPASTTTYTIANLTAISNAFDAIYATDRTTFGSEYKPGIDNDNHITILISPQVDGAGLGFLGYFYGRDEYAATPGTAYAHSNQREMFYVIDTPTGSATPLWGDAATTAVNAKQGYAVLAHEFQHMINFYHKSIVNNVGEDTWINEGLSMYAMQACGYGMPQGDTNTATYVNNYLGQTYNYSLTNWTSANYGVVYLYMLYLTEQYGGAVGSPASQAMLTAMVANNLTGTAQIEAVSGAGSFGTVFRNWAMANLLDGKVADPLYNYQSININGGVYGGVTLTGVNLNPTTYATYPVGPGGPQQPAGWSALYQKFTNGNGGALNISIQSSSAQNNLEAVVVAQ